MQLHPRGLGIAQPNSSLELLPPMDVMELKLPDEFQTYTGKTLSVDSLEQGRCSAIMRLQAEHGDFVVKVTQGEYRGEELLREHQVMQDLQELGIPAPNSIAFHRQRGLSWQLREYRAGETLRSVLRSCGGPEDRLPLLAQMATTLADIHQVGCLMWTWGNWKEASLRRARENMHHGLLDLEGEFVAASPEVELAWLRANSPAPGQVSLIHGDYRTKNLLCSNGELAAVLDWAFADFGDPYYDLAIALDYVETDSELAAFIQAYGLQSVDEARLNWCRTLVKFLNI